MCQGMLVLAGWGAGFPRFVDQFEAQGLAVHDLVKYVRFVVCAVRRACGGEGGTAGRNCLAAVDI